MCTARPARAARSVRRPWIAGSRSLRLSLCLAIAAVVAAGCGDDDGAGGPDATAGGGDAAAGSIDGAGAGIDGAAGPDGTPGAGFDIDGMLRGGTAPDGARIAVVWQVTTGTDYLYKFGEGAPTAADAFHVGLAADPPTDALNAGHLGVGLLVMVAADAVLPEGMVDEQLLEEQMLGLSGQNAVVFRDGATGVSWEGDFDRGYACGVCVPNAGAGFDSFAPVDCSQVVLQIGNLDTIQVCNWT